MPRLFHRVDAVLAPGHTLGSTLVGRDTTGEIGAPSPIIRKGAPRL
jgi:hypothetical protein